MGASYVIQVLISDLLVQVFFLELVLLHQGAQSDTGSQGGVTPIDPVLPPATGVKTLVQVAKVENLSSQRVKANFSWSKWSKLVQRSTSGGCGLVSFEVGQGQLLGVVKRSRPKIGGDPGRGWKYRVYGSDPPLTVLGVAILILNMDWVWLYYH